MKFTRVVTLCFAALMIFTVLSGCTAATAYQKIIYNDDSKIVKQADSFNFMTRIGNTTDKESSVKFGTFYGMETIWFVESEGNGTITLQYSSQVDKGKFKFALLTAGQFFSSVGIAAVVVLWYEIAKLIKRLHTR